VFQKVDSALSRMFVLGLPLIVLLAIGMSFVDQDSITTQPAVIQTLHGLAGLLFGLWMSVAVYISARLVFSKPTRNTILPRLVFLRERDEREAFLTGNATKTNFLITFAILILLLCLNVFHVSFYQAPPDQAPSDKNNVVTLSVDFSLIDHITEEKKGNATGGSKSFVNYSGLPISKTAILLFLIIWQIASYNYLMKQFSKKGAGIYAEGN